MTDRFIDIQSDSLVRVRNGCLQVDMPEEDSVSIPLKEIGSVVVHAPRPRITSSALAAFGAHGIAPVFCDDKHVPTAILVPLSAHHASSERLRWQSEAPASMKNRAWQAIVKSKIQNQHRVLNKFNRDGHSLDRLVKKVRSGDPNNIEARASRFYWGHLFKDASFRRSDSSHWLNHRLNYGYAILRSLTVSAITTRGLHPGLGLHHHNKYDPHPLASDLMEPFRPIVDELVAEIEGDTPENLKHVLSSDTKQHLAGLSLVHVPKNGRSVSVPVALREATDSLVHVFRDRTGKIDLPQWRE